ncbi:MBL fold metallo-hydrolase [Clostridium malenominatum]|uniref:MBL fold metallo-hydrolase n=1 Tax=Clostridium malenominatum TaxID=1539 RepID=A0ABN1IT54_9CLOT
MNEVLTLEVAFNFGNAINKIYPVILKDEDDMILIDCGYPQFLPLIKMAAEARGLNLDKLTKIIITHHDFDHMGALAEFKSTYPNVSIISSYDDEKYISGKEKSLRLQQAEALYDSLPEEQKADAENFHNLLKSIIPVSVGFCVKDGDVFPWCGGTEIISTPGHMPGHISLYLKESKTLIAGDALVVENGKLCIANPNYTLDMAKAKMSIKKLLDYDIEKIICYHGGVYTENIKASLQKII